MKRKEIVSFYLALLKEEFGDKKVLSGIPTTDIVKDKGLVPCFAVSGSDSYIVYQAQTAVNMFTLVIFGFAKNDIDKEDMIQKCIDIIETHPYQSGIDGLYNLVITEERIFTDEWYSMLVGGVIVFKIEVEFKFYSKSINR